MPHFLFADFINPRFDLLALIARTTPDVMFPASNDYIREPQSESLLFSERLG